MEKHSEMLSCCVKILCFFCLWNLIAVVEDNLYILQSSKLFLRGSERDNNSHLIWRIEEHFLNRCPIYDYAFILQQLPALSLRHKSQSSSIMERKECLFGWGHRGSLTLHIVLMLKLKHILATHVWMDGYPTHPANLFLFIIKTFL